MRTSRQSRSSTWRWFRSTAVVLVTVGALAGCVGGLRPPAAAVQIPLASRTPNHGEDVAIGVVREGWHTGLVLPVAEIDSSLHELHHWFPNAKYLAFGWGNRAFYASKRRGLGTVLAALLPSRSAIFIHGLPNAPEKALPPGSELRWVCASATEVSKLDVYLAYYLPKTPGGQLVSIDQGPWRHSRFFASTGRYDAFHTCNTWTMTGFEFAGLPVSAKGVVFAGQVMTRIRALPTCVEPSGKWGSLALRVDFVRLAAPA
ncbi:MAG: DUF2459 domain-containing protein [Rhodanobacteraceae bacterium]